MEPNENTQATTNSVESEDEISLLDLAIVLAKHKTAILGVPFVVAVVVAILSFFMTPIYTATTKILPPQQNQSAASTMLAQLGALAGGAGGAGVKNPSDLYIGMIQSRTVADGLVKRFKLDEYYASRLGSGTRKALAGATRVKAGKDGIITIEVDDKNPKRAAELANAYVEELFKLTNTLAITEASRRRLFFERQLKQAKETLDRAEVAARQAVSRGGVAKADAQGMAVIETTAHLRAQIAAKEIQIGAMRAFAAERNPDLLRAQQEFAAMRSELAKLETGDGAVNGAGGAPNGAETLARLRDVKYAETLFELLAKQLEIARIDEAKDSAIIEVIDPAIVPDHKSKPNRTQIVLLFTLSAGLGVVLWAFAKEALEKVREDPATVRRLTVFKHHLAWRKQ